MLDSKLKIAVVLTAIDKLTPVINSATDNAQRRLRKLMNQKFLAGSAMAATGFGLAKGLEPAVRAFANLEVANTDLKASMMDSTGAVHANFEKVKNLAESLGDKLPGTSADFNQLFKSLLQNGMDSENILNGVGKAAAYLGVDLKMPYEAAGEFAARMKEAAGVADEEMLKFMDTVSRLNSMGIGADEMRYAFSRSAGTLKLLGLQGLQASNDMGVLYAQLIRVAGMSGETAGTSFNNIMQSILDQKKFSKVNAAAKSLGVTLQFFKDGKFLGIENFVSQFSKLSEMDINKRAKIVDLLTGGGADAQAVHTIITEGLEGYKKMMGEMENKASLDDKVNIMVSTLTGIWESTTGTFENMLAALGAGLEPILKPVADVLGSIAGVIKDLLNENPRLAKFITMFFALASVGLMLAGLIKIIQGIRVAMALLNITIAANPFIRFGIIAIGVAALIYSNWDRIKKFFKYLFSDVRGTFLSFIAWVKNTFLNHTPIGLIIKNWGKLKEGFWGIIESAKKPFLDFIDWISGLGSKMKEAGKNIISSIYQGIISMVQKPIDAVKKMVGKIRNLLPFSPAKEGPLRDIHRIRLIETIADSVKPKSLIDKMNRVAGQAVNVFANPNLGMAGVAARPIGGAGGFSVTINLHGGASQKDADLITKNIESKFKNWIKKYDNQNTRVGFNK